MKDTTATARSMTDAELSAQAARLRREIPAAQSLLNAISRELSRRLRTARGASQGATHR